MSHLFNLTDELQECDINFFVLDGMHDVIARTLIPALLHCAEHVYRSTSELLDDNALYGPLVVQAIGSLMLRLFGDVNSLHKKMLLGHNTGVSQHGMPVISRPFSSSDVSNIFRMVHGLDSYDTSARHLIFATFKKYAFLPTDDDEAGLLDAVHNVCDYVELGIYF
jgi:hypothetical protein